MRPLLLFAALLFAHSASTQTARRPLLDRPASERAGLSAQHLTSRPSPAEGSWDSRFGRPGLWYTAHAVATAPNGDVYVGGDVSEAGGRPAQGIARWDGRRWWALGGGVNGTVYAIAIGADGAVYVGGSFTTAGGVRATSLAKWDPVAEAWSSIGDIEGDYGRGTVYALAVRGTTLYVGGDFSRAGGLSAAGIARWDGGAWNPLGGGVGRIDYQGAFVSGTGTVYALEAGDDALYVGGQFQAVDAGPSGGVARWDPGANAWTALGTGLTNGSSLGTVRTLALDGGDLYAGGTFREAGGRAAANVARWDGAGWSALGDGIQHTYGAEVHGLAVFGGALYAVGRFETAGGLAALNAARWRDGAWMPVSDGLSDLGRELAVSQDGLYAVGDFDLAGANLRVDQVARWTGAEWQALGQGITSESIEGTVEALTSLDGLVYAAGYFTHAGGRPARNIAVWDGTSWAALGDGLDARVYALAVGPDGALYAGGDFTKAGGRTANRIARWDPATKTWSSLGAGLSGSANAIVGTPDGLYVGGAFTTAGGSNANYVAFWDGTTWRSLGAGVNGRVYALTVDAGGTVYVGGDIERAGGSDAQGGTAAAGIAMWNGVAWAPLGAGVNVDGSGWDYPGEVYALTITGGQLYVGGAFDKAGTSTSPGLARWDGATWTSLGTGLGGGEQDVRAFATDGPWLYAAGHFETAGDLVVNNVAQWDTATDAWSALGSGLAIDPYGAVRALALNGPDLYAGGRYFLTAGAEPTAAVARWQGTVAPQGRGQLALDPESHDFGEERVGGGQALLVTVRNLEGAAGRLTGRFEAPSGPGAAAFVVTEGGGAFSLAPGESADAVIEFRPPMEGAFTALLPISHDGEGAAPGVRLTGAGVAAGPALVARAFDPAGPQLLWRAGGSSSDGFVFGPNRYGDRAKATALTVPAAPGGRSAGGTVEEVRVWFAYKGPMVGTQTATLHLYDGAPESGPTGAPLHSQTFRVADVLSDEDPATPSAPTPFAIQPAVAVAGSFFVVVDFGSYGSVDLAALAASDRIGQRVPEVWEQASDGSWNNVSDAWSSPTGAPGSGTDGWALWIEAALSAGGATPAEAASEEVLTLDLPRPNPFRDQASVRFTLPAPSPLSLSIVDVLGREVALLATGPHPAGPHTVTLDGTGLPSGLYILRLQAGTTVLSRPLTIAR